MNRPAGRTTHWFLAARRSILLQLLVGGVVIVGAADLGPQMQARLGNACRPAGGVDALRTPALTAARRVAWGESVQPFCPALQIETPVVDRQALGDAVRREAARAGVPGDIADAVAHVESGYRPEAVGDAGEIGLMQIRPQTAAMLGFRGSKAELAAPQTNIRYGVAYLAGAWRRARGDTCRALMKYRAGHGEERMTQKSSDYCLRAGAWMRRGGGTALADSRWSARTEGAPDRSTHGARGHGRMRAALHGPAFWSAHEARIHDMKQRIHARWGGRTHVAGGRGRIRHASL